MPVVKAKDKLQLILTHYCRPGASAQKSAILRGTREQTGIFQVWANMGSHYNKPKVVNAPEGLNQVILEGEFD